MTATERKPRRCGSADWRPRAYPVFIWCRMLDVGSHHSCLAGLAGVVHDRQRADSHEHKHEDND